jgi:hypothetical protein
MSKKRLPLILAALIFLFPYASPEEIDIPEEHEQAAQLLIFTEEDIAQEKKQAIKEILVGGGCFIGVIGSLVLRKFIKKNALKYKFVRYVTTGQDPIGGVCTGTPSNCLNQVRPNIKDMLLSEVFLNEVFAGTNMEHEQYILSDGHEWMNRPWNFDNPCVEASVFALIPTLAGFGVFSIAKGLYRLWKLPIVGDPKESES